MFATVFCVRSHKQSQSCLHFHIPAFTQQPGTSVSHSGTIPPSLITVVTTQQTKTEDIIPISDEALQLIGYSPEKTGLVFKGLKRSWTQQPMKEWIREAGITKNITFHSYRRTYATLQGAAGTDIRTIQSNMAHKSITTTQRYMKVVDSNKREASNRISLIRK